MDITRGAKFQRKWRQKHKDVHNQNQREWRQKRRQMIHNILGNNCSFCGTSKKLQLHHLSYEAYHTKSYVIFEANQVPENFLLVCDECHKRISLTGRQWKHLLAGFIGIFPIIRNHKVIGWTGLE